ncbi:hypothetical protein [Terracidiphilus sp.]|jgi:hypothetical protein|uniref:hypothetical protein n=1 Tax=Terracidiphilus sp. TaxID=1964191 RepID=UPI003C199F06
MPQLLLFMLRRTPESPLFIFGYFAFLFSIIAAWTLWDRRYKRKWQQTRARNWPQVQGKFDEGEIVTMRKGRSGEIAGYQVWFAYEYYADGDQVGIYTLPFRGEFPTTIDAEACQKAIAERFIFVHYSSRNPKRSYVLDEDLKLIWDSSTQ